MLNTLGPGAQEDLKAAVDGTANALGENGASDLGKALEALHPALSQSAATERELLRDQEALERFVVESADVVGAVAERRPDLDELGAATRSRPAERSRGGARSSTSLIGRLPATLRQANTTLVNLRATVRDLRPAVREARPSAPLLSEFLTRLQPLARDARPLVCAAAAA